MALERATNPFLRTGEAAPDFELLDQDGCPRRLSSERQRHACVLLFERHLG